MQDRDGAREKIQKILTDRKALSAAAAFVLLYALLVAFWRMEKKNKQRKENLYRKIEQAEIRSEKAGVSGEELKEVAKYVVEQDLTNRLPGLVEKIISRFRARRAEK